MIDQRLIEALFVDLVYLISQIIQTTFVEFLSLLQFGNINPIFGFLFSMFDKIQQKLELLFVQYVCLMESFSCVDLIDNGFEVQLSTKKGT